MNTDLHYGKMILLVDETNNGVVCQVPSDEIGNAVMLGTLNLQLAVFPAHFNQNQPWTKIMFNTLESNYQMDESYVLSKMPDKFVTPEWKQMRLLVLDKVRELMLWEFRCRRKANRVNDYFGSRYMSAFLIDQLNKCSPETATYTKAIVEWATIQGVEPSVAYEELKMREENRGLMYLRINAIYDKWNYKISSARNTDDLKKLSEAALTELGVG